MQNCRVAFLQKRRNSIFGKKHFFTKSEKMLTDGILFTGQTTGECPNISRLNWLATYFCHNVALTAQIFIAKTEKTVDHES